MKELLAALTQREIELVKLLGAGNSVKQIAWQSDRSYKSVDSQKYRLMAKLKFNDRFQLAVFVLRTGLVEMPNSVDRVSDVLSERQKEVLLLVACGLRIRDIASRTTMSVKSVESHKQRAMYRLGLTDRIQVFHYAIAYGLVTINSQSSKIEVNDLEACESADY